MVKYSYEGDYFVIEDYQNAKTFASFLPAVAGADGKPLWAFYCNQGQGLSSFGITSKDTPITPFESATLAYQNIALKGFRSFIKRNGLFLTPFFGDGESSTKMKTALSNFKIEEKGKGYKVEILYSSASHEKYPALLRKVTYTNIGDDDAEFEILDGLPVFFPYGLSNYCYKEMNFLMAAYCIVHGKERGTPFVKFKSSTGDSAVITEPEDGNGFFAIDQYGNRLSTHVDPTSVFGNDLSLMTAKPFRGNSYEKFASQSEQTENKLPCAFVSTKVFLKSGESYSFYEVYGNWSDEESFVETANSFSVKKGDEMVENTRILLEELASPATIHTGNAIFDRYVKQSYIDNGLRGGFPTLLNDGKNGQVYYLFGRKHGDMERDYNAFQMPAKFYSSGPGNFRDVNQNRRSDLYFHPFVKDYNIRLFFDLIQVDGQNPLNVRPSRFVVDGGTDTSFLAAFGEESRNKIEQLLKGFEPSVLYTLLCDDLGLKKTEAEEVFSKILGICHQEAQANFGEGYWIDHWTYNVDLLESYSSIYPDKEEELFFQTKYRYFYSPVIVEPRDEKYSLLPNGNIRQYGAIDLKKLKDVCEKTGFDISKASYLKDENGNYVEACLAEKIIGLVLIKFSSLDSLQMGLEMECEKPGWNDAMNGLPGLFASSMPETVELLRLIRYAKEHLLPYCDRCVFLLKKQSDMLVGIKDNIRDLENGSINRFQYWDNVTTLREELRESYKDHAESKKVSYKLSEILSLFGEMDDVLSDGIQRAKKEGDGIIPGYFTYRVKDYELTGKTNHLGFQTVKALSFELEHVPAFLEGSARLLKLHDGSFTKEDYEAIKSSELYDEKLKFYKTSASLDEASFEIGRVHAFTKGWLERECNFVHMIYKYLLGLLKNEMYDEFYNEIKTNFFCYMDPIIYGRDPAESSSFIVPSNNPDRSKWGQGYEARLTGANAEMVELSVMLFAGEHLFSFNSGELSFHLNPKLDSSFFDENNEVGFTLLGQTKVTYHNPERIPLYEGNELTYIINGVRHKEIKGALAEDIRNGLISNIDVEVSKK